MKAIILFFAILIAGFGSCSKVHAAITDLKIGSAQIFDVQYYWSHANDPSTPDYNCYGDASTCDRLNVSGLTKPYASTGSLFFTQPQLTSGQYFKFFNSTTDPGTYGLGVYNTNGTLAYVIHDTGDFYKIGSDSIFYVGGGFFGTVITTTAGYSYGSSITLSVGLGTPTTQDFTSYTPPSTTVLSAGQTATTSTPVVTIQSTVVTYNTRSTTSGATTTNYRTPVTTITYSDGTTSSTTGTETVYSTSVNSNVVTNKIVNGVLTTTTTPIKTTTLASDGSKTVTANGNATTTMQNVSQGLNYKVYDFDAYTYTCFGFLGCSKNLLGPYVVPNLTPGHYTQVATGTTNSGMYVPTNGSFPGMGSGTLVAYKGTITAPSSSAHPAGSVYRLYFYANSDDGFVMNINGGTIIDDRSTFQLQSVFGYTSSGWMDVVAGQTYNIEAWYWNDTGGYGLRLKWDYGGGQLNIPNSAFTTGWITETNIIDATGVSYSNTTIIDMSGSSVSLYPDYVTIGNGTPGDIVFGTSAGPILPQQTNVDVWVNRTVTDGNQIYIEQVGGINNTVTMNQDGNKNLTRAKIDGNTNSITVNQGVQGIGQNEIKINTVGDNNTLNLNQARTTQGVAIGTNGHYQAVDINGSYNTLTTQQSNGGGVGGQYMETTINGNQNSVTARQTDNGNKIMFTSITGNNNTVDAVQKGTGQHYLETKLTGNGNSVSAVQEGTLANRATLDLTNAGGPASVILQQNGGQNVSVTTTCATAGGCAPITVRQGY